VRTLTVTVYTTWLNRGSLAGAAQLACAMLAIIALLLWLERRGRKDRRYAQTTRRNQIVAPVALPPGAGALATIACAAPIALGFVLPAGFLLDQTVLRGLARHLDIAFLSQALTTLWLAGTATLTVLLLAVAVTTATRLARHGAANAMAFLVGLGYAAPGTVLALGLLGPLGMVDQGLNVGWRALTGERLGLVLMGSLGAILVAYTIRFLPIGTGSLLAGLERLSPNLDDAARTLGAKPRDLVLRIQAPLLRPALASAALLVFVDCLKELPATLLLRPLSTETLATVVYGHASRGSFEDGAMAALVIIAAGLVPVHLLTRRAERSRRA
jgi:iron(III) transport system permease protein